METLYNILNSVIEEMCDKYCKYPESYDEDDDKLYEERCDNCPLNRLI